MAVQSDQMLGPDVPYKSRADIYFHRLFMAQVVGIFLLYPGFFFYHFLLSREVIPPFLGGFYGPVSALLCPALVFAFLFGIRNRFIAINRVDVAFILICGYIIAISTIYRLLGFGYQTDSDLLARALTGVLLWVTNYFLFRGCGRGRERVAGGVLMLYVISLLAILIVTLVYQQDGVFIARRLVGASGLEEGVASYQGFARSAVLVLFILLASITRAWLIPVYFAGLLLLFLLSARSEFGGFLVVGLAMVFVRIGVLRFLIFAAPVFLCGVLLFSGYASRFAETSRIFRLLDWHGDTSLDARLYFSTNAWNTISHNPIFGDYGSYLGIGGVGSYSHNMLSAWVDFGIIGFAAFAYLVVRSFIATLGWARGVRKLSMDAVLPMGLAFYCFVMAISAKDMFDPLFAAAWGCSATFNGHRKSRSDRGRSIYVERSGQGE